MWCCCRGGSESYSDDRGGGGGRGRGRGNNTRWREGRLQLIPETLPIFHRCDIKLFSSYNMCLQCFDAVGWAAGRHPACKKLEWWGAGLVICLERGADLHMAQLMPLPLTVSCFNKIKIGFTFLVLAHLGSPWKGPLNGVCVCERERERVILSYFLHTTLTGLDLTLSCCYTAFGALTLLVGHQEEHPAYKNWVMMSWCGCLSGARCRLFAYGPCDAISSQNPIISCFI